MPKPAGRSLLSKFTLLGSMLALGALGCGDDDTPPGTNDASTRDGASADAETESRDGAATDGPATTDDAASDDASVEPRDSGIGMPAEYGLDERPTNTTCVAPERPPANEIRVELTTPYPMLSGLVGALHVVEIPGADARWAAAMKDGRVVAFADDPAVASFETLVDIRGRVDSTPNEAGLLGIAFHPRWPATPEVFLSYTAPGRRGGPALVSHVSRFSSRDAGATIDPASEEVLFAIDQFAANHNGGWIGFGPDGFLYAGFGDGGGAGDPERTAQDLDQLLGKVLRIDVDGGEPYGIPSDNPFVGGGGRPEIYAYGVRNPWRMSFDRDTGRLFAADVGQNAVEEVDIIERGGNYGWSAKEGTRCFRRPCDDPSMIDPIVEYGRTLGNSTTGGFVYRGSAIPALIGAYVFGDYGSGRVFAAFEDPTTGTWSLETLLQTSFDIASFAEDDDGELYVVDYTRGLRKLAPDASPTPSAFPERLSATGCVDPSDATRPAPGLIPYAPIAPLYSDGAEKERFLAIPDGSTVTIGEDGDFDFPNGTVLVKTFSLAGRRVETRLFVRHDDGGWAGYTYAWNEAQTDANLLPSGRRLEISADRTWLVPSRGECMRCHTEAAGRSLGLELAQLDHALTYSSTGRHANQLATLEHIGVFAGPVGERPDVSRLAAYDDASRSVEERARSYVHSNCSNCHRAGGPTDTSFDLRFATPLGASMACDVAPMQGDLGLGAMARLLAPGAPERSVVLARMRATGSTRMPPLGREIVDTQGTALVEEWLRGLSCP